MIRIESLNKKYGSSAILHDISFDISDGQSYGIIGENGAGKSTLFRCLAGLERYEGEIVTDPSIRIGYLPDTPYFYPLVTGKEFLDFCIKAGNVECSDKEIGRQQFSAVVTQNLGVDRHLRYRVVYPPRPNHQDVLTRTDNC